MTEGYRAAREAAVLLARSSRGLLRVTGRAPTRMLSGLLSGAMPPDLAEVAPDVRFGRAPYSALLTPKGRLVTDLRTARLENGTQGALLLDLPEAGFQGALAHLGKYLPPRMARVVELEEPWDQLTLVGPDAAELLAGDPSGLPLDVEALRSAGEGEEWIVGRSDLGLRVTRVTDVAPLAFDLRGLREVVQELRSKLLEADIAQAGPALWEVLRLEWGRPAFGIEMDEDTMPAEAGIDRRCIDAEKGCYTGQEVVVRIRDRGHVNRHLRGLLLGDAPQPRLETSLFEPGKARSVGSLRSYAFSPGFGQGIGLGYVRREIDPPAELRLGSDSGPPAQLRALSDAGWLLVQGDPTPYP